MRFNSIGDAQALYDADKGNVSSSLSTPGDQGRILVIDDEESVLTILKRALEERGYQVDGCETGKEGLANLSENRYDLVICDMRLPNTSGPQVFKVVKTEHLDLIDRMIFTTGDVVSPDVQRFLDESGRPILKKPFDLADLYRLVDEVMKRSGPQLSSP